MTPEEQQGLEDRLISGAMLQAENAAVDRFKSALREEIEKKLDQIGIPDYNNDTDNGVAAGLDYALKLIDTITPEK